MAGAAPRIGGGEKTPLRKMVWEEIVRRFDDAEEQVWLVEKIVEGKISPDYLLWNGRTR